MVRHNSIKFYRKMRGWSLHEFANLTKISVNTILKLERCEIEPKLTQAYELAAIFSMPMEELFFEEGKMPPKRILDGVE